MRLSNMDPKLLAQLCEVIEKGSLSRAALSLRVTQPTLTRNMKAIEEAVGAPVLRRGRYGVTPTSLGEMLAGQGRVVIDAMNMADETVQHWRTGLVGEVRLGVEAMFSASLMPAFLAANPMKESNFTMRVVAGQTNDLMQSLRKKEIDLAILPAYPNASMETLVQDTLFSDHICVLAGSKSPLAALPGKIDIDVLSTQHWISINNNVRIRHKCDHITHLLGLDGVAPKFKFDGDVTAPMALLRYSDMLAFSTRRFAEQYISLGGIQMLDIDADLPQRDIALWINKDNEHERCVLEISAMIKNYFNGAQFRGKHSKPELDRMLAMDVP